MSDSISFEDALDLINHLNTQERRVEDFIRNLSEDSDDDVVGNAGANDVNAGADRKHQSANHVNNQDERSDVSDAAENGSDVSDAADNGSDVSNAAEENSGDNDDDDDDDAITELSAAVENIMSQSRSQAATVTGNHPGLETPPDSPLSSMDDDVHQAEQTSRKSSRKRRRRSPVSNKQRQPRKEARAQRKGEKYEAALGIIKVQDSTHLPLANCSFTSHVYLSAFFSSLE